ncbi:MAG: ATP-dependent Clp protease adapter ClpS [Nannocystaceae bacterium]|nr:ATP-dependent Clp protease adapter ClpS [Nannocystaceae bacterium]
MSTRPEDENETGVVLRERADKKVKRPRMYSVVIHNDDYTPMDFVVRLLETVFHRNESEANAIMLHIHNRGQGVAGVYTHEIAETKVAQVHMLARKNDHPLMASMEPEEDASDND